MIRSKELRAWFPTFCVRVSTNVEAIWRGYRDVIWLGWAALLTSTGYRKGVLLQLSEVVESCCTPCFIHERIIAFYVLRRWEAATSGVQVSGGWMDGR